MIHTIRTLQRAKKMEIIQLDTCKGLSFKRPRGIHFSLFDTSFVIMIIIFFLVHTLMETCISYHNHNHYAYTYRILATLWGIRANILEYSC